MKHGIGSMYILVWGCFSYHGTWSLFRIEGIIDVIYCANILYIRKTFAYFPCEATETNAAWIHGYFVIKCFTVQLKEGGEDFNVIATSGCEAMYFAKYSYSISWGGNNRSLFHDTGGWHTPKLTCSKKVKSNQHFQCNNIPRQL